MTSSRFTASDMKNFKKVIEGTYTENGNYPYYACSVEWNYPASGGYAGMGLKKRATVSLKPIQGGFQLQVQPEARHGNTYTALKTTVKSYEEMQQKLKETFKGH